MLKTLFALLTAAGIVMRGGPVLFSWFAPFCTRPADVPLPTSVSEPTSSIIPLPANHCVETLIPVRIVIIHARVVAIRVDIVGSSIPGVEPFPIAFTGV